MSKRPGIKLKVASPCPASWDAMKGDDAVRHCDSCDKDVFQISNMSTEQVEQFLLGRKGLRTCVRFYQRADGTLLTSDCAVGKKAKRKKQVLTAVGAAAMGASALGLGYGLRPEAPQSKAKPACHVDSAPAPRLVPTHEVVPVPKIVSRVEPDLVPEIIHEVKGELPEPEYLEMLGDVAYEMPDEGEIEMQGQAVIDEP